MSDIVYPDSQQAPIASPPQTSGVPKTLGILSIVFGGLVTLGSYTFSSQTVVESACAWP